MNLSIHSSLRASIVSCLAEKWVSEALPTLVGLANMHITGVTNKLTNKPHLRNRFLETASALCIHCEG